MGEHLLWHRVKDGLSSKLSIKKKQVGGGSANVLRYYAGWLEDSWNAGKLPFGKNDLREINIYGTMVLQGINKSRLLFHEHVGSSWENVRWIKGFEKKKRDLGFLFATGEFVCLFLR